VSVFLGPHRYALRKGFFYVKLQFWQTASAKTAISHGVVFCLRLPYLQFHMVLLFHEELLDKKKRFDIVEKVAEG